MMTEKAAYTVAEVAALMALSRQTVTRLFEKEPGALVLERAESVQT
jgi:predicted transcriptional regulator